MDAPGESTNHREEGAKKFMRLKALDCFEKVLQMIRHGYPYARIAEFIQVEQDEYEDITRDSLIKTIRRFVDQEFHRYEETVDRTLPQQEELPPKDEEDALVRAEKSEAIDVLNEYGRLYQLQERRINMGMKAEKKAGTLMKEVGQQIEIAARLLDHIGGYQQDIGMLPKQSQKVDVSVRPVREGMSEPVTAKIAGDPASRARVLKFMKLAGRFDPKLIEDMKEDELDEDILDAEFVESGGDTND